MKLRLTLAFGFTVFLLGIPLSLAFPVEALGHSLIVAGAIIIGAWVIASEVSSRHFG
jgi:hypothetical protein